MCGYGDACAIPLSLSGHSPSLLRKIWRRLLIRNIYSAFNAAEK